MSEPQQRKRNFFAFDLQLNFPRTSKTKTDTIHYTTCNDMNQFVVCLPTSDKSKNYKPAPQHKKWRRRAWKSHESKKKRELKVVRYQFFVVCCQFLQSTNTAKSEMMRTTATKKRETTQGKNKWIASEFRLQTTASIKETKCWSGWGTDHDTSFRRRRAFSCLSMLWNEKTSTNFFWVFENKNKGKLRNFFLVTFWKHWRLDG